MNKLKKYLLVVIYLFIWFSFSKSQTNEEKVADYIASYKSYDKIKKERDSTLANIESSDTILRNSINKKYKIKLDSAEKIKNFHIAIMDSINKISEKVFLQGKNEINKGNYKIGLNKYFQVLKMKPKNADWVGDWLSIFEIYSYIAYCYNNLNMKDSTLYFLEKSIDAGLTSHTIFIDFAFYDFFNTPQWDRLRKKVDKNFVKNNPNVDFELAFVLRHMYKQDQYIRKKYDYLKHKLTDSQKDSLNKKWKQIDSTNQSILIPVLDKYGYPGEKLIGKENEFLAYFMILHADIKIQKKYFKLVINYFNKTPNKWILQYLIDKILVNDGKKQLYGTQYLRGKNNSCELAPMEKPENINRVRKELGLEPE